LEVLDEHALVSDDLSQLADRHVLAGPDVPWVGRVVVLQHEQAHRCEVMDVQEVSARVPVPQRDLAGTALLPFVEAANQAGKKMGALWAEIVIASMRVVGMAEIQWRTCCRRFACT
jgi:hypothetical protein